MLLVQAVQRHEFCVKTYDTRLKVSIIRIKIPLVCIEMTVRRDSKVQR